MAPNDFDTILATTRDRNIVEKFRELRAAAPTGTQGSMRNVGRHDIYSLHGRDGQRACTWFEAAAYALGLALEGSEPAESLRLLRETAHLAGSAGNRWIEAFADTEVWWLEARNGDVRTALIGSGVIIDTWNRGGDWANLRLSLRRVFGLLTQIGDHRAAAPCCTARWALRERRQPSRSNRTMPTT